MLPRIAFKAQKNAEQCGGLRNGHTSLTQPLDTSDYAALTTQYAQWTSEDAIWATYTCTIPPRITDSPESTARDGQVSAISTVTAPSNPISQAPAPALTARETSNGVVRDNTIASIAAGASGGPAQASFTLLARSQSNPSAYGVTCFDSSASDLSNHIVTYSDCNATVQSICSSLADPSKLTLQQ